MEERLLKNITKLRNKKKFKVLYVAAIVFTSHNLYLINWQKKFIINKEEALNNRSFKHSVHFKFLSGTFTFAWNFLDFFIIAISLGLATRFYQFSARIEVLEGCSYSNAVNPRLIHHQYVPDAVWYKIRREHIILCEFMEQINDQLSTIVFLSSLNNMYFICNSLLNIFTKLRYLINYIYFWFSLIFLISRAASVFMFASRVHDAAVLPLKTLYLVPSGCWTEEVQRFRAQILNEYIGLTGKSFYEVTRQNLFGMMATIITYEFMLLQFDQKNQKAGLPDLCSEI